MPLTPAQRIENVQTPVIPVVGEWIAQQPGTISLGQGVVHYPPPREVAEAVSAAARDDGRVHRYGLVRGIDDLLTEIQKKVEQENGITVDDRVRIVSTTGSNMGFLNAVVAIADVDDEIILLSPYYFNHEMAIDIAGCKPVIVPTDVDYQIDLAAIEDAITPKTRAIVTVSPNNPTGAVYTRDTLSEVNRMCRERGVFHISDEAYEYFVYGDESHFSPASLPQTSDHTISLYSLSKGYGMAGWRVGYMVVPKALETPIKKVQDTNLVCPPIMSQLAGAAALRVGRDWCLRQNAGFREVRDLVLSELTNLGSKCRVPKPSGAFYALAKLQTGKQDMELVEALIREFKIAVMPGSTFGVGEGCSIRIAYGALAKETVAEGMGRLVRGLDSLL